MSVDERSALYRSGNALSRIAHGLLRIVDENSFERQETVTVPRARLHQLINDAQAESRAALGTLDKADRREGLR